MSSFLWLIPWLFFCQWKLIWVEHVFCPRLRVKPLYPPYFFVWSCTRVSNRVVCMVLWPTNDFTGLIWLIGL